MTTRKISELKNLTGKVVLITGASGGLGREIALEAAAKRAIVVLCARHEEALHEVQQLCQAISHQPAFVYPLDVSDTNSIEAVLAQVKDEVGGVDVLVNNAGFGLFENAIDFDMKIAENMFRVNVLGMMYLTQSVAKQMTEEHRPGHIINIASQAGKMATQKSSVYSATKFAVLGYSNALRLELRPFNIQVTTVNPGPIATNFFNIADHSGEYLKKVDFIVLQPSEVAKKIVQAVGTHRREINLPGVMEVAAKFYTLFPHTGDFIAGRIFNNK